MRQLLSLACLLGIAIASPAYASPSPDPAPAARCFKNISLRSIYTVRFDVKGEAVQGAFVVEPDAGDKKEYPFTGTLHGKKLAVKFVGDKVPELLTHKRPLGWTLVPATGKDATVESLRVTVYGENYQTHKFSNYDITLEPCDGGAPPAPK